MRFQRILIVLAVAALTGVLAVFTAAAAPAAATSSPASSTQDLSLAIGSRIQVTDTVTATVEAGDEMTASTEILWDTWGTPHIFAQDPEDAFYAFGWAQMHSHANLLLQLYAQARGEAAEHFGEGFLPTDQAVRLLGIPTIAESWYGEQSPEFKNYLDAFADGMNQYGAANPDALSAEAQAVLPVSGVDIIGHTALVMASFIISNSDCSNLLPALFTTPSPASNGWALGPSYSASGNAMLLANPHLPWAGFSTVYQAHIVTPEVDVFGNTLLGFPVLAIAFTDALGWTHTVNTIDACDVYQLTLAGETVDEGYLLDGEVQPFETISQTIQVGQRDGSAEETPYVIHRSAHGPVVDAGGQLLAIRLAMLEAAPIPGLNEQWWDMAQAQSLEEFEQVLERLQLPLFTVIYADRDGHIMGLFNGLVPVRPEGDFHYWFGPVPGDDSTLIWTEVHTYAALPKVVDPPSGWVQNSNSAPWYMTLPPLNPADYPPYMAPTTINTREQRGLKMLMAQEQMTFEQVVEAKHSTYSEVADQLLPDLLEAARAADSELAHQAADVLEQWDREFNADSQGALLFNTWFLTYLEQVITQALIADPTYQLTIDVLVSDLIYATPFDFDPQTILETPRGLADEALAVAALETAAEQLQSQDIALDVAWGEVARLRRGEYDLPGNGNDGTLGVFRVIIYAPAPDGRLQSFAGDTHIAVVEFSDPQRAEVLLTYGNASQPDAFDIGDQLQLAADQQLRPAWKTRAEIEANLASREIVDPSTGEVTSQ